MGLRNDAERVRVGFVVDTAHGLVKDAFVFNAEAHTLVVDTKTGREVAIAAHVAAAIV